MASDTNIINVMMMLVVLMGTLVSVSDPESNSAATRKPRSVSLASCHVQVIATLESAPGSVLLHDQIAGALAGLASFTLLRGGGIMGIFGCFGEYLGRLGSIRGCLVPYPP